MTRKTKLASKSTSKSASKENPNHRKTYTLSEDALNVVEKVKEKGLSLNNFISEAIIEFGKTKGISSPVLFTGVERRKYITKSIAKFNFNLLRQNCECIDEVVKLIKDMEFNLRTTSIDVLEKQAKTGIKLSSVKKLERDDFYTIALAVKYNYA